MTTASLDLLLTTLRGLRSFESIGPEDLFWEGAVVLFEDFPVAGFDKVTGG